MTDAVTTIDDPQHMRQASRELLSLAFIDARNRTLRWLSAFAGFAGFDATAAAAEFDPPAWTVGHVAWQQEFTIGRNVRRARGEGAGPAAARLASIEPRADGWFDPRASTREQRWRDTDVADAHLRDYLAATLEATLELLERAEESDVALQVYRQALAVEDSAAESLAELAQAVSLSPDRSAGLWPQWPARVRRDPLWFPGQHFQLGSPPGGLVPMAERWAHDVAVPEFEIDAQPVQWAQYIEFVEDGGYDEPQWWSADGWRWAEAAQRRAPRYVEQLHRNVLLQRQGQVQRAATAQAVMHLSWHEAQAWCRWAGRRLPTEPEWELAACTAASRGFVWGDVWEWTASRAALWSADAPATDWPAGARGVRGGSRATVARQRHAKARRFLGPGHDIAFVGFRSCAV
jgi:formylglycine-generating enzyme required for sulfatase activity